MRAIQVAGTIASISSWATALFFQWQGDRTLQRNIAVGTALAFAVVIFVARWASSKKPTLETKLVRTYPIPSPQLNEEYDVFYPFLFEARPLLNIRWVEGSATCKITEQRPDGFRIRLVRSAGYTPGAGLVLEFTAEGRRRDADRAVGE